MSPNSNFLPPVDSALAAELSEFLDNVEKRLQAACLSEDDFISEMSTHLAAAGGKRFRPLMVGTVSRLGRPSVSVELAAVAVELVHLASLYHDDVMDEAPKRRGAESANQRWTNTLAILVGDILFARASELVAELGPEAVRLQAVTFARLVEGQIHETVGPKPGVDAVAHHLDVLSDKTGSLIALAARYGAMFSEMPVAAVELFAEFGEAIGLAFQIADDILDIASTSEDSGKTPGTDLREGILTMPMLIVQRGNAPDDAELISLLGRPLNDADHARSLELMRPHPAMDLARAEAKKFADSAVQKLEEVKVIAKADPNKFAEAEKFNEVVEILRDLAYSAINRAS
jgi:heptaprenyl diphosphate synthase